jgi:hypothetical protein|eukprot:COSAG01_NODE_6612_length_3574_cov_1.760207_2_plen_80_part_00
MCEWGCGHWLDGASGLPLHAPKQALAELAPALRPIVDTLSTHGHFERCDFEMPSRAIAKELASAMGVSELSLQGLNMAV